MILGAEHVLRISCHPYTNDSYGNGAALYIGSNQTVHGNDGPLVESPLGPVAQGGYVSQTMVKSILSINPH